MSTNSLARFRKAHPVTIWQVTTEQKQQLDEFFGEVLQVQPQNIISTEASDSVHVFVPRLATHEQKRLAILFLMAKAGEEFREEQAIENN